MMHIHLLLVAFVLCSLTDTSLSVDPHWNYHELGPDVWKDLFPQCDGSSQSPINILTACTTYQSFELFQFSSTYDLTQDFILTNNGHTISGKQVNSSAFPLTLSGGGLSETFTFNNFHLHWGENYNSGSEHQLNGQKYAGEIHFVHTNLAATQNTVLGMFMQTSASANISNVAANEHRRKKRRAKRDIPNTDNSTLVEWGKYFAISDQLNATNDSVVISLNLANLIGTSLNNFYRYSGSLTTPPCSENVIWTVFQTPIVFSESELESFRTNVYFEDYRGPQPINGRTVYRNFVNDTPSSISDYSCCGQNQQNNESRDISSNGNSILLINRQLLSYFNLFFLVFFYLIF